MLSHLSIQNYALIEKIEIDFLKGLSIITGETGAGKSILLGALSLIAGERADTSVLQDKNKKCVIEAQFDIRNYSLDGFFRNNDLDYSPQTSIRREISAEGKSRAFINDTPVTLAQLRVLSYFLIDIHSQHESLTLNESSYQLWVVDAFAFKTPSSRKKMQEYKRTYKEYKQAEQEASLLLEKEKKAKLDFDYWTYQFNELEQLNLKIGEQQQAESELTLLDNAEEIKKVLDKLRVVLNGTENAMGSMGVLPLLNDSKSQLASIEKLNPSYSDLFVRLNSTYIELKDISFEIENHTERIAFNPDRAQELTHRLDAIYALQDKHKVDSIEKLIEEKNAIEEKLKETTSLEDQVNQLQNKIATLHAALTLLSKEISVERTQSLPALEKELRSLLATLAMPNAQFKIEHTPLPSFTEQGRDKIRFLFSANKGSEAKEISKVASGGELSRLLLCIKSTMAASTQLPTIVFDEIDTGVSGSVADQMGKMILAMANAMQVIAITHLPQIAVKGNFHFTVYKEESAGKTVTHIKNLSNEERITEIAKMLSAGKITEASMKNAKELLN
jgi:DNA repair protein RecN (Recombination protein N)